MSCHLNRCYRIEVTANVIYSKALIDRAAMLHSCDGVWNID